MVQFYLRATAGYKIYFLLNMRYAIHWKLDQTICSSVWLKKLMLTINILIFSAWKCQMFKFVHCGTMLPWGNTLLKNKYIFNIYYIDYILIYIYIYIYIYILHLHVLIYWERKNESNLKIHSNTKHVLKMCIDCCTYIRKLTPHWIYLRPPTNMADCLLLFSLSIFSVVGIGVWNNNNTNSNGNEEAAVHCTSAKASEIT